MRRFWEIRSSPEAGSPLSAVSTRLAAEMMTFRIITNALCSRSNGARITLRRIRNTLSGRRGMLNRRNFLQAAGAGWIGASLAAPYAFGAPPEGRRLRMAVVTTIWYYGSHAWHMPERFLHGYPMQGKWHHPEIDVVSA